MYPSLFGWFLIKFQTTLKKMYPSLFGWFGKKLLQFLIDFVSFSMWLAVWGGGISFSFWSKKVAINFENSCNKI